MERILDRDNKQRYFKHGEEEDKDDDDVGTQKELKINI